MRRRMFGEEHPDVARSLYTLGLLANTRHERERSGRLLREALAMQRELLGDMHLDVASTLSGLSSWLSVVDQAASERCQREALAIRRENLGEDHIVVVETLGRLAEVVRWQGLGFVTGGPLRFLEDWRWYYRLNLWLGRWLPRFAQHLVCVARKPG